jgi:hypothetical protein
MQGVLLFDWAVPISRRIRGVYEFFFFFLRSCMSSSSWLVIELVPVTLLQIHVDFISYNWMSAGPMSCLLNSDRISDASLMFFWVGGLAQIS